MLGVELPASAGSDLAAEATDVFTTGWPIFVAMAGISIALRVLKRFVGG